MSQRPTDEQRKALEKTVKKAQQRYVASKVRVGRGVTTLDLVQFEDGYRAGWWDARAAYEKETGEESAEPGRGPRPPRRKSVSEFTYSNRGGAISL